MQVQHFIFHHENSDFSLWAESWNEVVLCSWMCSSLMFANKTDVLLDIRPSSALDKALIKIFNKLF